MFVKSVVAVSLLGLSINCFAREVAPGVELVYEKTTVTGENVVSGEHIDAGSGDFFFRNLLIAQTQEYGGSVRQNITMQARHSFSLVNQSQSRQEYKLRTWLCTNSHQCSDHIKVYYLNAGAQFTDNAYTLLTANFLAAGMYVLTAGTSVSGGENNQVTDSKYIQIR